MDNSISESIYQFIILILLLGSGVVAYYLYTAYQHITILKNALNKLGESFSELDEQAKLIVKTDLELNKAQEELDKRLTGLDALQKTSRLISTTLDEDEAFQRLNHSLLTELGFEKYLIYTLDEKKDLRLRVCLGYSKDEQTIIGERISNNAQISKLLKDGNMISSNKSTPELKNQILEILNVRHFVMTPILTQDTMTGLIFAGNPGDAFAVTEGDTELISILADQIGQAVENARLFEQAYHSQQALEAKVQERTKQLSSALADVQAISRNKSEFISAVSHELRTPLTSIKGYAALLIAGTIGEIPAKVKERLEKINKHSDNLVQLINDLLDISRIESGKTEMKLTPHAIPPIIANVQDLLTPQIKEKHIIFVNNVPQNCPPIPTDLSQIERVFINLISNAVKFTPNDGTITVNAVIEIEKITFSISDTGIGINEENTRQLFNEFYRIENEINQNVKGTGLGLALCKKIIEAHNGKIWVESEPLKGSTFYFTLPLIAKGQVD
ncbi:MAG: GAF domain-containing protein [Candidatus Omnitrophica bacterium]|nr:GAF domain-containing protein [Candidatus Omnitrophota bacterium]